VRSGHGVGAYDGLDCGVCYGSSSSEGRIFVGLLKGRRDGGQFGLNRPDTRSTLEIDIIIDFTVILQGIS